MLCAHTNTHWPNAQTKDTQTQYTQHNFAYSYCQEGYDFLIDNKLEKIYESLCAVSADNPTTKLWGGF